MVCPGTTGYLTAFGARLGDGVSNQLPARFPPESHPALGCVHGLGNGEPERPEISPVGERRLSVEVGIGGWVVVRQRIADHMGRGVGDAAP